MQLLPAALSVTGTAATAATTVPLSSGLVATLAPVAGTPGLLAGLGGMQGYASLALSGFGALQSMHAGTAAANQAKVDAANAEIEANEKAIERRERLLNALSQQNARTGAAGITAAGTPTYIAQTDMDTFASEEKRNALATSIKKNTIKARGKNERTGHRLGAAMSLLDAGTRYSSIG